ncbi:MAG: low specificity L-threonine aldolase [Clostridium sp.]|uniref:threonine aldolase family protein n=1 Tax=Clostridium sp. TaxID=1506 RepID=UPI00303EFB5A
MYSFKNDYSEGAHPRILNALIESNLEQTDGYGDDCYTENAIKFIKEKIKREDVDVHLFVGGTQTNLTSISAFLRPHEAVIAPCSGHVLVHETGAIEATGHKVISVEVKDGKLTAEHIKTVVDGHTDEHMVKPKLVYISNPTEIGTIYKKRELEEINKVCRKNNLFLYVDGARLGSALCSKENDIKIHELAELVDAFYIGGTKGGALMGEALVICRDSLKGEFRYHIKQKGGLFAKGRILGVQFMELFKDDLYFELAHHANDMADILKEGITKAGYKFMIDSPTNQIFPILPNDLIKKLEEKYLFYVWEKINSDNSAIRLVTSWATNKDMVLEFIGDL